ncbi:MAG: TolC family protein [Gammaproteobacteria bacterium]|nr:MAG: TolC family protein [Gammaproteobacteria bacterium]
MKKLLIGFLLVWGASLHAETLDLKGAIDRALKTDPRIEEQRHLVDAARAQIQEALGHKKLSYHVNTFVGIAPGVDGGFFDEKGRVRNDLYDPQGLSAWFAVQLSIIKPLFTFGKIEHYAAAAQGQVDVRREDVRLRQGKTILDVKKAYYGYLTARETRRLLVDVKGRVERALRLVDRWLEEGTGNVKPSDRYALESGIALLEKSIAEAEGVEKVALDGLKVLTGIGLGHPLEVADKDLKPLPLPQAPLDALKEKALEKRPEQAQLEAGLRARRHLVAAHKAEKKPNLYTGILGYAAYAPNRSRLNNPFIFDLFNTAGATPVIGIDWKWESGVQPAQVAKAKAELEALVSKADFARRGIPFEVAEAYYKVHAYHRGMEAMAQSSRAARRWMIASYADFEAGLEEAVKVMEAFKGYVLAHTDYLNTIYEYNMQVATLQKVTGDYP